MVTQESAGSPEQLQDVAEKDETEKPSQDQEADAATLDDTTRPRDKESRTRPWLRQFGKEFAVGVAGSIADKLDRALSESRAVQESRVVTLREVIKHLIDNRPAERPDLRGFLLREKTLTGWVFHVGFVLHPQQSEYAEDHAPTTFEKIHARRCETELDKLFDGKNVILFE
jgi:hypothetical protein